MYAEFNDWLAAKGIDPASVTPQMKPVLQAQWRAENNPAPGAGTAGNERPAAGGTAPGAGGTTPTAEGSAYDQKVRAIEEESARVEYIQSRTTAEMERYVGNPTKLKQLKELCAAAIADKKVDKNAFDLSMIRVADRFGGPLLMSASASPVTEQVIEAAICQTHKLAGVEKHFDERTLQAAHTHFKRGIGLQELLMIAAERNTGYRGSARDIEALCRSAFAPRRADHYPQPMAGVGPSSIAVPGILSNVANKFLLGGFLYGEQSWRKIARIKSANDFKEMKTYRLTGANKFTLVAPGGEIQHGTLSELTYTNSVDTYGKMLGIDRRDIRNDDLGAFSGASDELGRGAIDSLNEIFWTEWLNDSAFFPTDKSLLNYDDGATDSVLSLAGLDNANTLFGLQTKPDGTPMGIMPRILLTPLALWATGRNLMNGQYTASAQSTATVTTANIWQGMFDVVASVYLQSSAITGYSSTAWYLLADPNNVAAIEVAFLDGIESPIVEASEFDFDRLGLALRAYMDWGCAKQEYRAGVKLKGAA